MIRILNFFFVIATGFTCLWLNHVTDQTRVADAEIRRAQLHIAQESENLKVLQAAWDQLARPDHIQALAVSELGFADNAALEVASLELLPRRGQADGSATINTSASAAPPKEPLHLIALRSGQ